jgi:hypothetical protein
MSNKRRMNPAAREQDTLNDTVGTLQFLRSIEGIPLPNGCPDCPGSQTVREVGGEWRIKVLHEDPCPVLRGVVDQ